MLVINNLTKKFDRQTVVDNVSLRVESGEIFSIIGPNGSGKTTLIKMISGLLQPTAGEIKIADIDVSKNPKAAKAKIGYLPDEPAVWPYLTGEEFLQLTGALFGLKKKERSERIPQLLKIFNLTGIEQQYFDQYSRGNKQKFSILAALLHQPQLLLIDEPIVGLDPASAEIAQAEFTKFTRAGGAICLVTHTLPIAEKISHRLGILANGKLLTSGRLAELKNQAGLPPEAKLDQVYQKLVP